MDLEELINKWRDDHHANCLEGNRGLDVLNNLAYELGYLEDQFKYGSPLEQLLKDNPGACEAILQWLCESNVPEWKEALSLDIEE